MRRGAQTIRQKIGSGIVLGLFLTIVVGSVMVARRNIRLGRGDRRGAMRLAVFVVVTGIVGWLLSADHVATFYEVGLFVMNSARALLGGTLVWLLYMAIEPYARRSWPKAMISWARILSGRFRDPLVGRDVLVGAAFGAFLGAMSCLRSWLPGSVDFDLTPLSARLLISEFIVGFPFSIFLALGVFFLLFVLRAIVRDVRAAIGLMTVLFMVIAGLGPETPAINAVLSGSLMLIWCVVLVRFGLLSLLVTVVVFHQLESTSLTYNLGSWYAAPSIFAGLLAIGLACYGFHTALAGRLILKDALLEA